MAVPKMSVPLTATTSRACLAAMCCDNVEKPRRGFNGVGSGDHAEPGGARRVATDGKCNGIIAVHRLRAKTNVGGQLFETGRAAAIDSDRDFGIESRVQGVLCDRTAQIGGDYAGIKVFAGIEAGQSIGQDRNAVRRDDVECGNIIGE